MPYWRPYKRLVGVNRQVTVLAFQFGDGFSHYLSDIGLADEVR